MSTKRKTSALPLLVLILVIVIGLVLFGMLGVYVFKSTNFVFRGLSRIIPYPAVVVNWDFVGYDDYSGNIVTMRRFLSNEEEVVVTEEEIRERVLNRLIANAVLEQLADEGDIQVFDYEVEKVFQAAIENLNPEDEVEKDLKKLFGWSTEDYKKNVVRPFVLQNKLTKAIYDDQEDAAEQFAIFLQEEIAKAKIIYFVPH